MSWSNETPVDPAESVQQARPWETETASALLQGKLARIAGPGKSIHAFTPLSAAKTTLRRNDLLRGRTPTDRACASCRRFFLDALHVLVRQAEMMADFMHQNMRDQIVQRLIARLRPVVENRAPVEKHHIRLAR